MYSQRFQRIVQITQHALQRMAERNISETLLLELLETGEAKHKDECRLWLCTHWTCLFTTPTGVPIY